MIIVRLIMFSQQADRGMIVGKISSSEDHQALVGANILLEGTVLGTSTDAEGNFSIRNIPVGRYSLTVSMIGFKRMTKTDVVVTTGEPLQVSLELEPVPVQTEPVVVTANKREQSLQEVPVSVSVIDEQALSSRNTVTVDDALRYVPGVNITQSQVNIRGSTGYSHGVGTRVLLLVDGLPFLSGDTGEIIWESLPPGQIERVEVVKGAGSALYGSSALGGVINIITKSVRDHPQTRLRAYGGMYEMPKYATWQWAQESRSFTGFLATHQQRVGNLSITAGASRTLDDGYKRNDFWRRWNTWARLGYDISPFQSIAVSFSLLDQGRGNFLYWKNLDHVLEPQDDQLTHRVQSQRWNLSGSYRYFFSRELYTMVKLSWYHSKWEDNIPSRFDPLGSNSRSDFVVGEIQTNYQLSDDQIVTVGLSGTVNQVSAAAIFGEHSARAGALYLQDEIRLPENIMLTAGGRLDLQKLEGIEVVNQVNPKIGLVYNPSPSTSLRASVGRGFRAPSIAEIFTTTEVGGIIILPNANLKPERSWSFEVGGSHIIDEHVSTELSLFQNELWDLIEPAFGTDGYVHFQNIIRARITGMEVALNLTMLERLLVSQFSYTYVYPEDITNNDILKYRPRHLLYLSQRLTFNPFQVGVDFRYISRTDRIDDELVQLGIVPNGDQRVPIYLTDVRLSAEWKFAGLPVVSSINVNNLFQYYYSDFIGNLGPTRNYVLSLEARLE